MPTIRWRLAAFLEEKGISAYALAKQSAVKHPNTVYRIARPGHEPTRVDIPTLNALLDGLRELTGEEVRLTDILTDAPEQQIRSTPRTSVERIWQTLDKLGAELQLSEEELLRLVKEGRKSS